MTTVETAAAVKAPWWFWLVAAVGLLWNGFGAFDYTMSHVQGEAYYRASGMTDAQIAFMATYPAWMHGVWAVGVWGSALGAVLLLLRSRWAFHAFAVSMLGAIGNCAHTLATPGAAEAMGGPVFPVVIVVICGVFIWLSWAMTKRGVLR
ncbi:hypothetical protein [Phenylobacterium sp.]|uniref:hypothetical protein n=1 Tax=Phenylobacterium sp. TaxID=1871053 RepID=UPI0025F9466C|nr:hypothetical protein [Phenylobacterium sp.]MBX3483013.1 hypothetical protein [Phenylobacterium sp.]MCW5761056.1 hypothetical protein [Phenylobacterium sp.]